MIDDLPGSGAGLPFVPWTPSDPAARVAQQEFLDGQDPAKQHDARMAYLEGLYKAGSALALLEAVSRCARRTVALPAWAAAAVLRINAEVMAGRKIDLNEAFGVKGAGDPRQRRRRFVLTTRTAEFWNALAAARRDGAGISDELKAAIGAQLGMSHHEARGCYDNAVAFFAEREIPLEFAIMFGLSGPIYPSS